MITTTSALVANTSNDYDNKENGNYNHSVVMRISSSTSIDDDDNDHCSSNDVDKTDIR